MRDKIVLPSRRFGQNFLIDSNICKKIVRHLEPQPNEAVIEIGPGKGALTEWLLAYETKLILLERDIYLARRLKQSWPHVPVIVADAMQVNWKKINRLSYNKVIGNLPYNIAGSLIWILVSNLINFSKMVFTVQKEVAQRMTAQAGNKTYGPLTVWIQNFAQIKYEFTISPQVFRPRPKIDSAVISIYPISLESYPQDPEKLSKIINICFQKRRKQLGKILQSYWTSDIDKWLEIQGLEKECRPEQLSPLQFRGLSQIIKNKL